MTVPGAQALARRVAENRALTAERDSARSVAVQLEQENAHLVNLMRALAVDLRAMHAAEAIDLETWPNAAAITEWLEGQP